MPMPMRSEQSPVVLAGLLLAALLSGWIAITTAPAQSEIALWWPPAGIGVLVLLWAGRERMLRWGLALYATLVAANLIGGHSLGISTMVGAADVMETLIVVGLLTSGGRPAALDKVNDLTRLVLAAFIGTTAASVVIAMLVTGPLDADVAVTMFNTFLSHLTAVILIVPVGLTIRLRHLVERTWLERAAHVIALTAAMAYVFSPGQSFPLAWVPAMVLVLAAMRLGPRFTAMELWIVSAGVQFAARHDWGPFPQVDMHWWIPALIGKAYLVTLMATTLPLALAQRQNMLSLRDLQQRTGELLDQTRFTQTILDATADLVLVVDDESRVLSSNRTATRLTGYTAAELKGHGWLKMTPPEREHEGAERWQRILDTEVDGEPAEIEIVIKDGTRRRLMGRSQPLRDGGPPKHVIIGLDVTAERNAAGWLMHILRAESTTAIIGIDIGGQILVFSRGAELLTGRAAEDVINTPATDLLRFPGMMRLPPSLDEIVHAAVRDEAPSTRDWSVVRGSEEPLVVSLTTSEISNSFGGRIGYLLVAQDVTESREAERRLADIDEAKNEFVSTASHEIRTPMTSVIGYTEMLLDGMVGDLTPAQHEIINAIARNGHRLLSLADELLTVSRLDASIDADKQTDFDLHDCLDQALSHYRGAATARNVQLRADFPVGPVICHGNVSDLQRVFLNLISNAVKFTPEGGAVTCCLRQSGGVLQVSVSDTGIGIPQTDLDAVFQRFYRSENAVRGAVQGTGLGLSIVAAIIEQHQGSISVESEVGTGTTFMVTLPAPVLAAPEPRRDDNVLRT